LNEIAPPRQLRRYAASPAATSRDLELKEEQIMSQESKPLRTVIVTLLILTPIAVWFFFLRPEPQWSLDNKLMQAIYSGNTKDVKALLAKGANPNTVPKQDIQFRSGLMYAFQSGEPEIVQALIDKGADVNYKDSQGNTPLKILRLLSISSAMPRNTPEMEKILLKAGAHL